jgi:tetratricopeptide (TPR) repeat protein
LEKVPFVIVSLVFMGAAIAARHGALAAIEQTGAMSSLARACYGTWFYLLKTALPLDLIAVYPAPRQISWRAPLFLWSILGTLAMSLGLFLLRRRWPGLLAAWLSYLAILAPNSGIIRTDDQIAADRYSYLSTLGWVVVVAAALCWLGAAKSRSRPGTVGMILLGLGSLLVLVVMTWQQCRTWRDSETLWTHALAHGAGSSSLAHYNLGLVFQNQGRFAAALAQYSEALRLNPGGAQAHNNVGVILQRQGKLDAAAAHYAEAQRLNPDYLDAHFNLGLVLSRQGKFTAAAAQYAEALRLNPGLVAAHINLGADLSRQGQHGMAAAHFVEALRLKPGDVEARKNLEFELSLTRKPMRAAPR